MKKQAAQYTPGNLVAPCVGDNCKDTTPFYMIKTENEYDVVRICDNDLLTIISSMKNCFPTKYILLHPRHGIGWMWYDDIQKA